MNRYFFYLVFINSIANIIIFAPHTLMHESYSGALIAIIIAMPIGTYMLYTFSKAIMKFPNKNISEIVKMTLPRWLQIIFIIVYAPAWYMSGLMMLFTLVVITKRFMTPDISINLIAFLFIILALYVIQMDGITLLYALEILMVFTVPFLLFIFIKSILSPFFNWNACLEIVTHTFTLPSLASIGVTTYAFSGYTDMVVFNSAFNGKFQIKHLWLFPVLQFILLCFAFFIPLGFLGTQAGNTFQYPWITATDSISIKMGPIERALFLYLLIYLIISLTNVIIHWHVSMEMFKGLFQYQLNTSIKKIKWILIGIFAIGPFTYYLINTEDSIIKIGELWLPIRFFMEIILVIVIALLAKIAYKKGLI